MDLTNDNSRAVSLRVPNDMYEALREVSEAQGLSPGVMLRLYAALILGVDQKTLTTTLEQLQKQAEQNQRLREELNRLTSEELELEREIARKRERTAIRHQELVAVG